VKDKGQQPAWKNEKCDGKDAPCHPFRKEESVISCSQNPFKYEGEAEPEKRSSYRDSSTSFMEGVRWPDESEQEKKTKTE
jgi:hypothetical protein